MGFANVNTGLKTILDSLTGNNQVFSVCYDYPEPKPTSFPAAFPTLATSSEETETTAHGLTNCSFLIRVISDANWSSDTYNRMLTLLDKLLRKLRRSSASNNDYWTNLVVSPQIRMYYTDSAAGKWIIGEVSVTAQVLTLYDDLESSPSPSVSPSVSISPSVSPSVSISPSVSPSVSISPSVSPSVSISPSPSS